MVATTIPSANEVRGISVINGREVTRPRASGVRSMSNYDSDGDSSTVQCPWEGCDYTSTETGVKVHHGKAHGESIAGVSVECAWCGETNRVKKHVAEKDKRHFCDQECMGQWRSEHVSGENHHQYDRVEIECDWCGETIKKKPCNVEKSEHHFCDQECHYEWKKTQTGVDAPAWKGGPVKSTCVNCDASIEVKQSRYEEGQNYFCSRACVNEWQVGLHEGSQNPSWSGGKVVVSCAECGESMKLYPQRVERCEHHFCSDLCYRNWHSDRMTGEGNPAWQGGVVPYGKGWTEEKREHVRDKQNRICAGCGIQESETHRRLDVHHIIPAREFDDDEARNDVSNLVALCPPCHRRWEGVPLRPQLDVSE